MNFKKLKKTFYEHRIATSQLRSVKEIESIYKNKETIDLIILKQHTCFLYTTYSDEILSKKSVLLERGMIFKGNLFISPPNDYSDYYFSSKELDDFGKSNCKYSGAISSFVEYRLVLTCYGIDWGLVNV